MDRDLKKLIKSVPEDAWEIKPTRYDGFEASYESIRIKVTERDSCGLWVDGIQMFWKTATFGKPWCVRYFKRLAVDKVRKTLLSGGIQ